MTEKIPSSAPASDVGEDVVVRICFVCTGNTCRSPMAAAVANAQSHKEDLTDISTTAKVNWKAFSAGLCAQEGERISPLAAQALQEKALYSPAEKEHRAHTLTEKEAASYSLLVGMTRAHAQALKQRFPSLSDRICAFPTDISDPFGQDLQIYRQSLWEIMDGVAALRSAWLDGRGADADRMPHVQILRLNDTHLEAAAELERLCFAEPWSAQALSLLTKEGAVGFAAALNGRVLAYGGMILAPNEAQITNIAVHPDARRMGLGRAILKALLTEAEQHALEGVFLEVRRSNEAAISLYLSEGFAVLGERRRFYSRPVEDALVMGKPIGAHGSQLPNG